MSGDYLAVGDVNSLENEHLEESIGQLMGKYGSELKNLAYTYVRDWGRAEEIVQDVFLTCYKKFNTFRGDSSVKTWLYRITMNRSKDVLSSWSFRNLQVRPLNTMISLKDNAPSPEDEALRHSERNLVVKKVFALPVKYREVIILHYYSDLNVKEISRLIDKKPETVRTRLRRARQLLEQKLKGADKNGG